MVLHCSVFAFSPLSLWERVRVRGLLNQHLPRTGDVFMHQFFSAGVDQLHRSPPVGARQGRCGAEQAANQRAFFVHRAAVGAQMHTVQLVHGRFLLGGCLARQARHFFRRGGHRSAAVMATRYALKRWYLLAQEADFMTVAAHPGRTDF